MLQMFDFDLSPGTLFLWFGLRVNPSTRVNGEDWQGRPLSSPCNTVVLSTKSPQLSSKNSHDVSSRSMVLCWAMFDSILGHYLPSLVHKLYGCIEGSQVLDSSKTHFEKQLVRLYHWGKNNS